MPVSCRVERGVSVFARMGVIQTAHDGCTADSTRRKKELMSIANRFAKCPSGM